MTVADRLGKGSSFGTVRTHRLSDRGRAKAIAEGSIPAYELVRIQLTDVAATPLNPRRNFGTDEERTAFGESLRTAQLQPCTGVTRTVYLKLWPDHADLIGAAEYVLVNGERRYRCALHVGLEALDFVVRDELATSREEFVDTLLKENLQREDFDVIERARGVAQLVEVCAGNQAAAAGRLGRDRSWVTNQLVLLTLPDEIQVMLSAGLPERDGRRIARHSKDNRHLSPSELLGWLDAEKGRERQSRQVEKDLVRRAREEQVLSVDNTGPLDDPVGRPTTEPASKTPAAPLPQSVLSADNTPPQGRAGDPVAAPASNPRRVGAVVSLPWSDLDAIADVLFANLKPDEMDELAQLIADRLTSGPH